VQLLNNGRDAGRQFAASALARLAHDSDNVAMAIAVAGATSPLVNLLGGSCGDKAQEEAAGALYALAANAANRLELTEAGGIGPLVQLLGTNNTRARNHAEGALVRDGRDGRDGLASDRMAGMAVMASLSLPDYRGCPRHGLSAHECLPPQAECLPHHPSASLLRLSASLITRVPPSSGATLDRTRQPSTHHREARKHARRQPL
jgi:hypothetical protein